MQQLRIGSSMRILKAGKELLLVLCAFADQVADNQRPPQVMLAFMVAPFWIGVVPDAVY